MLVLARKVEQRIQIGSDITITVLRIRSGAVKIGIEAPSETPVYRTEVLKRRATATEGASNGSPASGAPPARSPRSARGVVSTPACDEDAEIPRSEGGAAVRIGPGILLSQRGRARSSPPSVAAIG
jgi:carbon storage regulator